MDEKQIYPSLSHLATAKHKPCLLILNSFSGVGKLSVARLLFESYGANTQARLIDNHLLIDPVEVIHPGRTPKHYILRQRIRALVFNGIETLKNDGVRIVIMTTCSGTTKNDVAAYKEFVVLAQKMDWILVSMTLDCDVGVNRKRLQSMERKTGKQKLLDHVVLENIRNSNTLLDPEEMKEVIGGVKAFTMRLDTTNNGIEDTAEVIAQFILEKFEINENE